MIISAQQKNNQLLPFFIYPKGPQMHVVIDQNLLRSESAGANPYLSADGMLNFSKISTLQDALDKSAKKVDGVKPVSLFVAPVRAKPEAYSVTAERKGDLKYRTRRAVKVVERKRLKPESLARVKVLLTQYPKDAITATQYANQQMAVRALNAHMKKAETAKGKISKEKSKVRDADNKAFEQSLRMLSKNLEAGGITAANVATAQSMFGLQMMVRLDNDHVVAVVKSDISKFRAAKRANAEGA